MPGCLTAYLPDAARRWLLRSTDAPSLGRAEDCGVRIDHPSVSRRHARLEFDGGRWTLADAGSKNGVHVEGRRVLEAVLPDRAWLRVGDIACEWRELSDAEAGQLEARGVAKRADSRVLLESLQRQTRLPDLLRDTLRATVELAECERGFLLLSDATGLRVAATHGIAGDELERVGFAGSAGAVQRALAEGQAVVVNDARGDEAWSRRESVIAGGLRALLCLPLRVEGENVGLVYADSARPGCVITATDLDLLQAFAERAALWISARRGLEQLSMLAPDGVAWPRVLQAQGLASA